VSTATDASRMAGPREREFVVRERPEPAYMRLLRSGELERRVRRAIDGLAECRVCPRDCRVDRLHALPAADLPRVVSLPLRAPGRAAQRTVAAHIAKGTSCFTGRWARVSSAFAHFGEEDCLRGWRGSGTIFFSFCNLRCVFCQNWDVSQAGEGMELRPPELARLMLGLQDEGCHNVNLVTPEHVVPQVLEAVLLAAEAGLGLPLVYNTSAYDSLESLALLDGVVDVYMPDFKTGSSATARRWLKAEDYPVVARQVILEMHRQVGPLRCDRHGLAVRGLLVRHLIMPGAVDDAAEICRFLALEVSPDTYVNLMDQYFPAGSVREGRHPELTRRALGAELEEARARARAAGLWRFDRRAQ
jgi:putative pyruvate formate lyase activating enzyme